MVAVFVQAVAGRRSWETTRASIEASDIANRYLVSYQAPDKSIREHFLDLLLWMSKSPEPWCLRLEDDILVNRYILENIAGWPAKDHPDFGAGWLFDPGGTTRTTHDRLYGRIGNDRWHSGELHCCQAVLLKTEAIPVLRQFCADWFSRNPSDAQDIALSRAVAFMGKRICVHAPPLAEHLINFKSSLGHGKTRSHTTEGAFKLKWRRG